MNFECRLFAPAACVLPLVLAFVGCGGGSSPSSGNQNPQNLPLVVTISGSGTGTVTSTPSGINCGQACNSDFPAGTSVKLTATPGAGSVFAGWGGACSGTGSCSVTMGATNNDSVSATFNLSPQTFSLAVSLAGSGSGTVTSAPSGI